MRRCTGRVRDLPLSAASGGKPLTVPVRRDRDGNLGFRVLRIPHGSYRLRAWGQGVSDDRAQLLARSEATIRVLAGRTLQLRCKLVTR